MTTTDIGTIFFALAAMCACGSGVPAYKAELQTLERDLSERKSVACIQNWLNQCDSGAAWLARDNWPDCLRDLHAADVRELDGGGVAVTLSVDRRFVAVRLPTLAVYPPGKRPALDEHEPSVERPGYLGTFGDDAYIQFSER